MNNTKAKELEIKIVDFVCDDWKDNQIKTKMNELKSLVKKYYEEKSTGALYFKGTF